MAYEGTTEAWIVGAVRTPIGKRGGALSPVRPGVLPASDGDRSGDRDEEGARAGGGFSLEEVGLVELNEAYAAQSLAVLHEWGMEPEDE